MILITIGSLYLQILTCRNIFCVLIMIVPWVCTGVMMQHITVCLRTFIGAIYRSMSEIGCAAVHIASDSNPFSMPTGLCRFGFISTFFHITGVDYIGELPHSPSGNKWILTAVCPFSNYLRAILVSSNQLQQRGREFLTR